MADAEDIIAEWPEASREVAGTVMERYGEPHEATQSMLLWRDTGPWKRTVVQRDPIHHKFPKPHEDIVEQTIDYRVPTGKVSELAEFDGSVIVERTAGELSARCHDEEANFLAINLAHDIVMGKRSADEARRHYADSMLAYRRGDDVPYMQRLLFEPHDGAADPDERILSDEELRQAAEAGQ